MRIGIMLVGAKPYQSPAEARKGVHPMSLSFIKPALALILVTGMAACAQNAASTPQAGAPAAAAQKPRNSVVDSSIIASAAGQPIEKIIADHVAGVRLSHTADGAPSVQI